MSLKKISGKKREKPARMSKIQEAKMNQQAVGDEPRWKPGQVPTQIEKAYALNWYATCGEIEDGRGYLIRWFERRKLTAIAADLALVPNTSFPRTACWLARMDELGADMKSSEGFILTAANDAVKKYAAKNEEAKPSSDASVTSPADAKLSAFIANLEDVVDRKDWTFSTYDAMKSSGFPLSKAASVIDYYSPLLDEIRVAIANTDVQVYEGYKRISKKELKAQEEWLVTVIDDCRKFNKSERVAKPRKKKSVSVEKKLKSFTWLRESQAFKAASVDPGTIIGGTKVYLFNVKYKTVTLLEGALNALDIKGKSIIGFDVGKSWTVAMGRKAEEAVSAITQGNEAAVIRRLGELRKDKNPWPKPKNLVDENTLVLRVVTR